MSDFSDIPACALGWHRDGRAVALATVVETWGSAPRPVGSQLVVTADGAMEGSVSGGCVEGAVIVEAIEAMSDGKARLLEYGVSDGDAFAAGLACGGRIRVLVDPVGGSLDEALLGELVAARAARKPVALLSELDGSGRRLVPASLHPERFRTDQSGVEPDGRTFVAVHNPPLRLVIVGAVHIAQALLPMARLCGYAPIIVDPRPAFATPARFPDAQLIDDWPDEVLDGMGLDPRTAVVTLSHDPKIDDPAIQSALRSQVFYIGCLGSSRTHAKRLTRLAERGYTQTQLARIHGPAGLRIGGRAPGEIALSILAEITSVLRTA